MARRAATTTGAPAATRSGRARPSVLDLLDGALFTFAGLATIWLAYLVVREGVRPGWPMLLLVVFWILVTYLLLPRLHRILTRIYVPGYFIGRARTSDNGRRNRRLRCSSRSSGSARVTRRTPP